MNRYLRPKFIFIYVLLLILIAFAALDIFKANTHSVKKIQQARNLTTLSEKDLDLLRECQWEKHPGNPILTADNSSWDNYAIRDPFVLKEKGKYFLFYHSYNGRKSGIGLAVSENGYNFEKYGYEPILEMGEVGEWDSQSMQIGSIIKMGDIFIMYYSSLHVNSKTYDFEGIGIAESKDLYHWKKFDNNPIWFVDENVVPKGEHIPFVVFDPYDNNYYLYSEKPLITGGWSINVSISNNPYMFGSFQTIFMGARSLKMDLKGAANPKVYQLMENLFLLGYNGFDNNNPGNLRMAISNNGINWKPFNNGKSLLTKKNGEWDGFRNENTFILHDDKEFKLYYFAEAAAKPELKWSIGLATCSINK